MISDGQRRLNAARGQGIGGLTESRSVTDVTRILSSIEEGDPKAAEQLLPLVYDELRKLATEKMAKERSGQTLQATALVHEAYVRLIDADEAKHWNSRGHFFAAAAEAMRRILVESARRKLRVRHGGKFRRHDLHEFVLASPQTPEELVALSDALDRLTSANAQAAELIKLRFLAGLSNDKAAEVLGVSARKANQIWAYARAWLLESLGNEPI
jgi:RNA polymerase sigma factor (TIGR02999 family)